MNEQRPMAERNSAGRRLEQYLPDVVRRTLVAGLGAVLLTEEGLRSALSDLKLPKEAIAYLAAQADRSKRELSNAIARELRSFLDGVDLSRVLRRVLAGMTLEFTTQVRFVPNDPAVDHEDGHGSEGGERTGAGARRSRRPVRPAADAREGRRRKGVFSIHHDDERSP